jgi:SET domain-containing protein
MSKAEFIAELSSTYVMLQSSQVAGVGVFAITDIPKGCRKMFSPPDPNERWITLAKQEVAALPAHARFMIENYCLYDNDLNYFVPEQGFKKMDLSLFINHHDQPNIRSINDGDYFEALRDIKAGEELFLDYGEIVPD